MYTGHVLQLHGSCLSVLQLVCAAALGQQQRDAGDVCGGKVAGGMADLAQVGMVLGAQATQDGLRVQ